MKKTLLILALFCFSSIVKAQTVDEIIAQYLENT